MQRISIKGVLMGQEGRTQVLAQAGIFDLNQQT